MIVKVCGLTRLEDAVCAVRHGATALGFIFVPGTPRYVSPVQVRAMVDALPGGVPTFGVFVNATLDTILRTTAEAGVTGVQLHGDEPASLAAALGCPTMRATSVDGALDLDWPHDGTLLLDAVTEGRRGGSGVRVDWERAAAVARVRHVVLAGGLTPENVEEAIAVVRPIGVDVSSGVEEAPGVKNHDKIARFIDRAQRALARQDGAAGGRGDLRG